MARFLTLLICLTLLLSAARADEAELIKLLESSDAPAAAKDDACQKLKLAASAKAVPALAALLADPALSHSARYALESMDAPEAAAALRDALPKTTGLAKAGIIESLGQRRDREAVDALKELARDADGDVAAAAVAALGRIGGAESVGALRAARSGGQKSIAPLALDAMLACADGMLAGGFRNDAARVYREVHNAADASEAHRTAACRGLILAAADDEKLAGSSLAQPIKDALTGSDRADILAALRLVTDVAPATTDFIDLLPTVGSEIRVALIEGLAQRGDRSAAPPIAALAKDDKQPAVVRVASLRALGIVGDRSMVHLLARAAAGDDAALRDVARQSLVRLRAEGTLDTIIQQIETASPEHLAYRVELIRALGHRYEREAAGFLMNLTESRDDAVSSAAFQSLAMVGHDWHVQPLVRTIARTKSEAHRAAAERTLRAIALRAVHPDQTTRDIGVGLAVADPPAAASLLRVLPVVHTPGALAALRDGTRSQDPVVADAAVRALASTAYLPAGRELLGIARDPNRDEAQRVLALRGAVRLADETPALGGPERAALLKDAFGVATRVEEKRLALSALGRVAEVPALLVAEAALADRAVLEEAALACLQIARTIGPSHPAEARRALDTLVASGAEEKVVAEAKGLREKLAKQAELQLAS